MHARQTTDATAEKKHGSLKFNFLEAVVKCYSKRPLLFQILAEEFWMCGHNPCN